MGKTHFNFVKANKLFTRIITGFTILFLSVAWLLPMLAGMADAAQLTSRSLNISSGQPAATGVTYTYTFTPSAAAISSIKFVECTSALSTYGFSNTNSTAGCTAPTGCVGTNCLNQGTGSGFTVGNGWTNTTTPTRQTSTLNDCAPANNVLCITRTAGSAETAVAHTFSWNTQTNPSTANTAFYIGIYTYSDASFSTANFVDSGTVASAVVQTLTINAAVAEVLNFCAGSTTADTGTAATPADCTAMSGTSLNLGTLDTTRTNVSPVAVGNGGDGNNGIVMLRTNAVNGATVSYDAIQQSGTAHLGTLRISGANCTTSPFQCINAIGTTKSTIIAGTQNFGMTVAAVDCNSTTSYSCTYGSANYNLVRTTNYNPVANTSYDPDTNTVAGTTAGSYAWDETGTTQTLASSTTVVDDEALILKFAATPSITTTFGSYTAKADFIAVATY